MSGRTAVYRRKLLMEIEKDFMHETFWGVQCLSGDDKRLTTLVLERGYLTYMQRTAEVWSTFPTKWRVFFRCRAGLRPFGADPVGEATALRGDDQGAVDAGAAAGGQHEEGGEGDRSGPQQIHRGGAPTTGRGHVMLLQCDTSCRDGAGAGSVRPEMGPPRPSRGSEARAACASSEESRAGTSAAVRIAATPKASCNHWAGDAPSR